MKKIAIIYHADFLLHTNEGHPEHKGRLEYIINALEKNKMFSKVEEIAPVAAKVSDIALIHQKEYIDNLKNMIEAGKTSLDMDTYLTPYSFDVALLSAGGAITAVRETVKNNRVCFSLGRPPGHHAEPARGMGFCLFNNIAIAAKVALGEFNLKKILILDIDVHHGNGTQKAFYNDDKVFFISIHQSPAYPGTGFSDEKGAGKGIGYNLNIPLSPNSNDEDYEQIFREVVEPAVADYRPELILVSAGFDAYYQDPLASMNLTEKGFQIMGESIKKMADRYCGGKVVFCLEGGYHLEGQAQSFLTMLNIFVS